MTNNNTNLTDMITRIYINGYLSDDREYVKKEMNKLMRAFGADEVRAAMPDADEEFNSWYYRTQVADTRVDDPELHSALSRIEQWDTEYQGQQQFYNLAWSAACRAQEKLDKLEANTGVSRATVENKGYWHKRAGEAILHMEAMQDQFNLGLLTKEDVRKYMQRVYQTCDKRLKTVRWFKKNTGKFSIVGYMRGVGYSVTDMRAMCNTALTILEEMGYRIPNSWWKTNSKKEIVVFEFSYETARQDRTQEDWNREIEAYFYQL